MTRQLRDILDKYYKNTMSKYNKKISKTNKIKKGSFVIVIVLTVDRASGDASGDALVR